jgi:hypothetical protein
MNTEWGEVQVLDAHANFVSQPFFMQFVQALRGTLPVDDPYTALAQRLGWELPTSDHVALGRRWVTAPTEKFEANRRPSSNCVNSGRHETRLAF